MTAFDRVARQHRRRRLLTVVLSVVGGVIALCSLGILLFGWAVKDVMREPEDPGFIIHNLLESPIFISGEREAWDSTEDAPEYQTFGPRELAAERRTEGACTPRDEDHGIGDWWEARVGSESGPIVGRWDGKLCVGDYWTIPTGATVANQSWWTISISVQVPESESRHRVTIGPWRRGTLPAPCIEPPMQAWSGNDLVAEMDRPLCVGDVWTIEQFPSDP